MPAVTVQDVIKVFGKGGNQVVALHGVSFAVDDGEIFAIVGPSGSGKTTLLHILAGLDSPTAGRVFVDGGDIAEFGEGELSIYRRDKVGVVFQSFNLIPDLTALENVELPMRFARTIGAKRETGRELLRKVGLSSRVNHFPDELSGGEQQRVALAIALANDPPLILADEPTGELDTESAELIVALLRDVCKRSGKSSIIVTHDERVASIADRIGTLRDGRIEGIRKGDPTRARHENP